MSDSTKFVHTRPVEASLGVGREPTLMSLHDPATLYCRFIESVLNHRKLDRLDQILAGDVVDHAPEQTVGIEAARQTLTAWLAAFSDLHVRIDDLVVDGDHLMARLTATGTHDGPLGRLAPTGKRVRVRMFEAWVVQSDRCIERWLCLDRYQLLRELGLPIHGSAGCKGSSADG
jgi:predicted ester cyclase